MEIGFSIERTYPPPTAFKGLQENQRPHQRTSRIVYLVQGHISAYVPHVSVFLNGYSGLDLKNGGVPDVSHRR